MIMDNPLPQVASQMMEPPPFSQKNDGASPLAANRKLNENELALKNDGASPPPANRKSEMIVDTPLPQVTNQMIGPLPFSQ